jgi:hypothetical protein
MQEPDQPMSYKKTPEDKFVDVVVDLTIGNERSKEQIRRGADLPPSPLQGHANQETGNGALQAVKNFFDLHPHHDPSLLLTREDHMLAWLWSEGFKLVPVDGSEDDEPEYEGPDFGTMGEAAVVMKDHAVISDIQGRLWHVDPSLGKVKRVQVSEDPQ